jgi:hypothetical protein
MQDTSLDATHRLRRRRRLHQDLSPTRPSGRAFGFESNSSALLVRDNPGQPGQAEPLYASYGSREEGARHRLSIDAAAGEISESPDMGRAVTKRVDYHGSNYFRLGHKDFPTR